MEPSSSDKKDAGLGTIELKILETRETSCSFIIARFEHTSKLTEIKKHSSSHQTFTDVFHFRVTRQQGDLDIEVWQKNMIFKDKLQGTLKIPLSDLLDEQAHANWYPLAKPKKAEKDEKDDEEDEEPAKEKKKKGKNAEIRLEVKFTRTEKPKEVLTGVVVQGKWTKDTSVGSIINNRDWAKNPQFLLSVERDTAVTIKLRQPEDCTNRASFYIARYDDFYNGRCKVVLDTNDLLKVENFYCPITAPAVDAVLNLEAGEYIIIPFSETVGYVGEFTLAASAKKNDDIDMYKLPKTEQHVWKELSIKGEWTEANAGGGDILGLLWRKNPQYVLTLTTKADICAVIYQDDTNNSKSIGLYIAKQVDPGKKIVSYAEEVGKTESFKLVSSNGTKIPKLPAGSYVIIPCTYEPNTLGAFFLTVFSSDHNATLSPSVEDWKCVREIKGEWKDSTAGGSPNNNTYTDNPQFHLTIPSLDHPVHVLIQLVQEAAHYEETGVGFLVIKRGDGEKSRLKHGDFSSADVFCKPEGWMQKIDVVCRAIIQPSDPKHFTIIPSTFKPGVNRSFQLNVYSEDNVTLEPL